MAAIRVLAIDDSMVTRRQVQLALVGHNVETAPSAEAGLAAARRERPDVLILDEDLPGTAVGDVLAVITGDPELRTVPVVLLTEDGGEQTDRTRATYPTVVEVLSKPLSKEAITEAVESALAAATGFDSGPAPTAEQLAEVSEVLATALRRRLVQVPEWEHERGASEPGEFYLRKLLSPSVLRLIATRLSVGATATHGAHRDGVAVWDADRAGFVEPLLEWLARRHGLLGVDATASADPLAEVVRAAPTIVLLSAEAVGADAVAEVLPKLAAACPNARVIVTCGTAPSHLEAAWHAAGAVAVLQKPVALLDLEPWLFPSAAVAD